MERLQPPAAGATAVALADSGKRVMLVSTDPASNLQDVFGRELTNKGTAIEEVPGLHVANFDPITAAQEYMESVVGPYRGLLPESAIANMEEQSWVLVPWRLPPLTSLLDF